MRETPETPEPAEPEKDEAGGEQDVDLENDPAYSPDDEGLKDIKGG